MNTAHDPITLEIVNTGLHSVIDEMTHTIFHTGYSTIIRETYDASCAVLTKDARLVGMSRTHGVHLSCFEPAVDAVLKEIGMDAMAEGDVYLTNHPYRGGSPHATDTMVVTPVFYGGEVVAFVANLAHKPDIGGLVPGTNSAAAKEIFHEGLMIPPVRLYADYKPDANMFRMIEANSRTPEMTVGDLRGQVGTNFVGERGVKRLCSKSGPDTLLSSFEQVITGLERQLRAEFSKWPDGSFEEYGDFDPDATGHRVHVHVKVTKKGDGLHFDFSGCDDQGSGPLNMRPWTAQAVSFYAALALTRGNWVPNHGLNRAMTFTFRRGSVLDPVYPHAVNMYSVLCFILTDVLFRALGQFIPHQAIADSGGGLALVNIGGVEQKTGRAWLQYEMPGSAYGGCPYSDGESGISVHVSNVRITPVEIVETEFPVRVLRTELIRDSGGAGKFRGGLGMVREEKLLGDARFTLRTDKYQTAPKGIFGGLDAAVGRCVINPGTEREESMPCRVHDYQLKPGDVWLLETPGGGGYGNPMERDAQAVLADLKNGFVSLSAAEKRYGVVIDPKRMEVDLVATSAARSMPA